ncbi:MAG: hypothetical protein QM808_08520 [Steroidobacteraceae bacterium]
MKQLHQSQTVFIAIALGVFCCNANAADADKPAFTTGPVTAFGETAEEAANKKLVMEWMYMQQVEGKPKEAFEKYVSKNYCNHSHMTAGMDRKCASYDEMLAKALKAPNTMGAEMWKNNSWVASVNGEMVTVFGVGGGINIFRVADGKVTDHWDASPPIAISIKGPGGPRQGGQNGPSAAPVLEQKK